MSLSRLASATNMSKSGLYAHFSSKEELQLATVERAWEVFERAVLGDGGGEAMGGLEALLERWLAFYERRVLPGGCLFLSEGVHSHSAPALSERHWRAGSPSRLRLSRKLPSTPKRQVRCLARRTRAKSPLNCTPSCSMPTRSTP